MKKLLIAVTLATLTASSAFAKSSHSNSSTGPVADPYVVIVNGEVVGRDPDPNVRLSLMRDPGLLAD
jgi:hypothetical protein